MIKFGALLFLTCFGTTPPASQSTCGSSCLAIKGALEIIPVLRGGGMVDWSVYYNADGVRKHS